MATEIILKAHYVVNTTIPENIKSMMVKSLVNLVEILPEGLESKKRIGDLITFSIILLWILVVDVSIIACIMYDLAKDNTMYNNVDTTNPQIYCDSDYCSSNGKAVQVARM
jgi:hypothetical protein